MEIVMTPYKSMVKHSEVSHVRERDTKPHESHSAMNNWFVFDILFDIVFHYIETARLIAGIYGTMRLENVRWPT
jgi:hypothetical protein